MELWYILCDVGSLLACGLCMFLVKPFYWATQVIADCTTLSVSCQPFCVHFGLPMVFCVLFCCILGCLLFLIFIEFVYLYFPVLFYLSVSVKWLAVKTASEMTYIVSSGALNSTQPTNHSSSLHLHCAVHVLTVNSGAYTGAYLKGGPNWRPLNSANIRPIAGVYNVAKMHRVDNILCILSYNRA